MLIMGIFHVHNSGGGGGMESDCILDNIEGLSDFNAGRAAIIVILAVALPAIW